MKKPPKGPGSEASNYSQNSPLVSETPLAKGHGGGKGNFFLGVVRLRPPQAMQGLLDDMCPA